MSDSSDDEDNTEDNDNKNEEINVILEPVLPIIEFTGKFKKFLCAGRNNGKGGQSCGAVAYLESDAAGEAKEWLCAVHGINRVKTSVAKINDNNKEKVAMKKIEVKSSSLCGVVATVAKVEEKKVLVVLPSDIKDLKGTCK